MDWGSDQIIFGADATAGIVAVEMGLDGALVYRRTEPGVVTEEDEFHPWLAAVARISLPGARWQP
ncbi:MAG: hypothetical protein JXA57_08650, partial [Armatimonadetes bacterium]|nr:hypothetical protein [Armatimonadota bacterium]